MKLLTEEELAEQLRLPLRRVRELRLKHGWPHTKFGREIRYTGAQVQQILNLHAVEMSRHEESVQRLMRKGLTRRSAEHWAKTGEH